MATIWQEQTGSGATVHGNQLLAFMHQAQLNWLKLETDWLSCTAAPVFVHVHQSELWYPLATNKRPVSIVKSCFLTGDFLSNFSFCAHHSLRYHTLRQYIFILHIYFYVYILGCHANTLCFLQSISFTFMSLPLMAASTMFNPFPSQRTTSFHIPLTCSITL